VSDLKRISVLAIFFLVVLRIAIGWQFLYEGLWKYDTLSTTNPWTAKGYLANAEGPFRDYFRSMVSDFPNSSDPDDLLWLDFETVDESWQRWQERFTAHFDLSKEQQSKLEKLVTGPQTITSEASGLPKLPKLPEGVPADLKQRGISANLAFENGYLAVKDGDVLVPKEVDQMLSWIGGVMTDRVEDGQLKATLAARTSYGEPQVDEEGQPVRIDDNLKKLFAAHVLKLQEKVENSLGYREKLRAALKGNPERVGVYLADNRGVMGEPPEDAKQVHLITYGEIEQYKDELAAYERARAKATMPHEFDHLSRLKTKINGLKQKAVGPVKALDAELKEDARELLTAEQLAKGPLPQEDTPLVRASHQAMWGLLALGGLLIIGLATRLAALGGAVMLTMFYLVMPPWPGVPEAPGATEHSLIVNKNLIEAIALLAIAALPTGSWFGVDGIFRWMFRSR
jgi:uncharacterized membrane protein YphA (DoxX/SURF4 family)